MINNQHSNKMQAFIDRLFSNPALNLLTPLQKEENLLIFLKQNEQALTKTLNSNNFFPDLTWSEIKSLYVMILNKMVNNLLIEEIDNIVKNKIDYSYLSFFRKNAPIYKEECIAQLSKFLKSIIQKVEIRRNLDSGLNAIKNNFAEKYIIPIFQRREYIYFELTKVEKNALPQEYLIHLIKTGLLLKYAIFTKLSLPPNEMRFSTLNSNDKNIMQQQNFINLILQNLVTSLPLFNNTVLEISLHANLNFLSYQKMEATSRIIAIMSERGRNYIPNQKVEKGAESPDKSWFNIHRRNYKFFGFDIKMLDEFYKIAADARW